MTQDRHADRLVGQGGVGNLVGHPDGEGEVGEVAVVRGAIAAELDAAAIQVVEAGVAQGEQRVDR